MILILSLPGAFPVFRSYMLFVCGTNDIVSATIHECILKHFCCIFGAVSVQTKYICHRHCAVSFCCLRFPY